jgi:hypothetical protein
MRTMKGIPWRMGLMGVAAGAILVMTAAGAQAQRTGTCSDEFNCRIGTDRPASIVIFPKLEYNSSAGRDTIVQLVNAGERRTIDALCFYVNANGHCSNNNRVCNPSAFPSGCDAGATCVPGWVETDFRLTLTKRQPISWRVSEGMPFLPCDQASPNAESCTVDDQGIAIFNAGNVPPVPEDPFIGELKCIQIDETEVPVEFNDMIGSATIITAGSAGVDVNKQNAIGVQALPGRLNEDDVLCLGGEPNDDCPDGAEYVGCPQTLIMDHFFDNAVVPGQGTEVTTQLTLVPCSQNFRDSVTNLNTRTTIQFLVYNEFEQRFSTSYRIACFEDRQISDIDTRLGPSDNFASIFNVAVQGTVSGQSRIRAVSVEGEGRGVLGQMTESHVCNTSPNGICTTASNLKTQGSRQFGDKIIIR